MKNKYVVTIGVPAGLSLSMDIIEQIMRISDWILERSDSSAVGMFKSEGLAASNLAAELYDALLLHKGIGKMSYPKNAKNLNPLCFPWIKKNLMEGFGDATILVVVVEHGHSKDPCALNVEYSLVPECEVSLMKLEFKDMFALTEK